MLKYFAALGSWAGNENSIEKLLTLIFCMNTETHKRGYCLKSSFLVVRYLTEVFSGARGGLDKKRHGKKSCNPFESFQATSAVYGLDPLILENLGSL